jgi:hypothetical protein
MTEEKKVKHTPGPWKFDKVAYGQDLTYHIQTVDQSHRNTYIGDVGGGLQFNAEITANAKLIAAAPDLLEVVRMLSSHSALENEPSLKFLIQKALEKAEQL